MVSEFGVNRQALEHIQQLRQLSGVSLTEWALQLHSQRDETVLQQLYAHCDIPEKKQAAFNKLICTYLSCFRDATWSLLDTHKK
jgi:DNA-binding FadR family transcriptional regulator